MKIKWLGQSAFLIASEGDARIIIDPYRSDILGVLGGWIRYGRIEEAADIVVISHRDPDHNNVAAIQGNPQLIEGIGTFEAKGIKFKGIASYHGPLAFRLKRSNTIFCFTVDDIKLCFLGDLGHQPTEEQVAAIGEVDVLFIPVGGRITLKASGASKVINTLKPRVAIPMHYRTDKNLPLLLAKIDPFLKGKANVRRLDTSEVEFKQEELPSPTEIVVLKHAL
ncbi:MAG: MBL fold metallo-hydrolase [Dehalococcoidia bacterium]|nr:MBL fold metallo-hydrolase [Dehalococcoidia bacterium]